MPSNGEGAEDVEAKYTPGGPSNDTSTEVKIAKRVEVKTLKLKLFYAWFLGLTSQRF